LAVRFLRTKLFFWPRRTHMQGVYSARRPSFMQFFPANVCTHYCSVFFLEDANAYLRVNASNRAISMGEIFHVPLEPVCAFVCSYPMDRIFLDGAVALWTGY